MAKFTSLSSHMVALPRDNVDTDQIIPARFLKITDKHGLAEKLFFDWRYMADGSDNRDFPLNRPESQGAQVLVAGENFGSGSSREHAPWALVAWGFRAVIAVSFADIFRNNALKNGLLPVAVSKEVQQQLLASQRSDASAQVRIDLAKQQLQLPDGSQVSFAVDSFSKHCLLEGIDELEYILSFADQIDAFEERQQSSG